MSSLTSIPEGFNPTVAGDLYLSSLTSKHKKLPSGFLFSWQNGKYVKADGMFTEVVSHKSNVYRVKKIAKKDTFYLITDGKKFAHGETLKEAKDDLMYKISDKNKSDYKHLKLSDILTFEEGIMCYRVITGACSFGTKDFVKNRLEKKKPKYSISEIITLTRNEYGGSTFGNFFNK